MRILYASERPPYPFFLGGAARCAHLLLHNLANQDDFEATVVGSADYQVSPWFYPNESDYPALNIKTIENGIIDCGYPIQVLPNFYDSLSTLINEFKPDVVWSQLEGAREILELSLQKGIQGLYYVHDAEFDPKELQAIAGLGCHIVCSSGFLAKKARRAIGRPAQVVYPAAELYFGTESDPEGYITMINPHRVKGLPTFLEIAKRLPEQRFLLLESWKLNDQALQKLEAQLNELPNVRFLRRVSDMRTIYRQTKLLLAPSIWEEGFGMVALEAQSCRIPVLASVRGGLPESVGDGGMLIDDYLDVDAWLKAIEHVINDADHYRVLADQAYRHAASPEFSPPQLAQRFLAICTEKPPQFGIFDRQLHRLQRTLEKIPFIRRLLNKF